MNQTAADADVAASEHGLAFTAYFTNQEPIDGTLPSRN
jgi:hypothetical protein